MLIDTHCHLDASEFTADRPQMLAASREAGVGAFVVPAIGVDHFSGVYQLVDAHPDVYFALGIHPLLVDQSADSDLAVLRERVEAARAHPRFVGIG
ncbi:MAG: TatD family hydrolase, partial [Lautropia sp.]